MKINTTDTIDYGTMPSYESCVAAPYDDEETISAAREECRRFRDYIEWYFREALEESPLIKLRLKRNPYE